MPQESGRYLLCFSFLLCLILPYVTGTNAPLFIYSKPIPKPTISSAFIMIDPPASHKVNVNASEQDHLIDSVTVFQAGRAEVKRRVQLQLKQGQNQIVIERLPSLLVKDSLRVQGTGTAAIFDVVYHCPNRHSHRNRRHDESSDEEDEEETECRKTVQALEKQRGTIENQISFLQAYGRSLSSQNSNTESLEQFLDVYAARQDVLNKRIQELDLEIKRAEKALREVQKKQPEHKTKAQRRTKVTVTVMSKEEGNAELTLTYVVWNASWTPIYELRASISSSPNLPSSITLYYQASLTQATGEDWPEAVLTLSTAAPYRGADMPKLTTWRIGVPPASEPRGRYRTRSRSQSPRVIYVSEPGSVRRRSYSSSSPTRIIHVDRVGIHSSSPPRRPRSPSPAQIIVPDHRMVTEHKPTPMAVRQADVVDTGVLSATFNIPGRSNVPSDQGNHKVLIGSLDFQITPEWICIPRKDESVFLRCKVVNSSEFTFLPGEVSVFIGDSFVSKSQIQHVPPNDSFQLSLGTDPTLRVTYAPVRTHKRTNSESGFNFPGRQRQPKQLTTKYSQQITIRNTRPIMVPALHILDHVPVSNLETLKVNVVS
ncbi:unnamed protein product, partial [Rhizoctonia solani]